MSLDGADTGRCAPRKVFLAWEAAPAFVRVVAKRQQHELRPGRYIELTHAAPVGSVWQNLDPGRFTAATGLAVLPIVIEQDAGDARGDGLIRNWPPPDLGIDAHRSYMLQWIAFAGVIVALWVWFNFLRKR